MPKRKKWLPDNVTAYRDRHGKRRYRFRKTGLPTYHFKSEPGTEAFREELKLAQGGSLFRDRATPYSMDDLASRLFRSPRWLDMKPSSQNTYRRIIERYLASPGTSGMRRGEYPAKSVTVGGLEKQIAAMKDTPAAANNLRKALKMMFKYAVKLGWMETNPAALTDGFGQGKGWHTWTDEEIDRYRAHWPYGTMARLTIELAINTAARRCNLAELERDNLANGRWVVEHVKDNDETDVQITAEARKAIDALPAAPIRYFITGAHGKPYTIESLGNRFRKWARAAGCPGPLHGIRKGVSRQLAEAGVTPLEGRAITGHKTDRTFAHYAAKADRKRLADAAQAKLIGEPNWRTAENNED